jgi:prepilin-type N-terminal cleavage/methylation domain-containing protein
MPDTGHHSGPAEPPRCSPAGAGSKDHHGFTLLEIVAVLLILSLLAGIAVTRYLRVLHRAEVAGEDATIATLQASVDTHWVRRLVQGQPPRYPQNPFASVKRLPLHYRLDQTAPSGTRKDRRAWVFVPHVPPVLEELQVSLSPSDNAPAILTNARGLYKAESVTRISGVIFHQRPSDEVYFWIYDQSRGVISGRYRLPIR